MKLKKKKYRKIKFEILKTNHILIEAKLNGVSGRFILDTGASNSCVGKDNVDEFLIKSKSSEEKVAGVGSAQMETEISIDNVLKLKKRTFKGLSIVVFDLSNINEALMNQEVEAVSGIIGADVLIKAKAVIDYENKFIYLSKK
ncbi:MAG: clan AA aspartic protease [Flavobacteriaceae bacterium]|nr:clan AA aspartic protease [Flavobacteriaceae bacterium]